MNNNLMKKVILKINSGSRLYGTDTPESDKDLYHKMTILLDYTK